MLPSACGGELDLELQSQVYIVLILSLERTMKIQINTDRHIQGHEALSAYVSSELKSTLSRVSDHITTVEVHLSDENGNKSGQNDKRCMMEARLEGRQPIAVTNLAETLDKAINGAIDKLVRLIESTLGRMHDQTMRRVDPSLTEEIVSEE